MGSCLYGGRNWELGFFLTRSLSENLRCKDKTKQIRKLLYLNFLTNSVMQSDQNSFLFNVVFTCFRYSHTTSSSSTSSSGGMVDQDVPPVNSEENRLREYISQLKVKLKLTNLVQKGKCRQ